MKRKQDGERRVFINEDGTEISFEDDLKQNKKEKKNKKDKNKLYQDEVNDLLN